MKKIYIILTKTNTIFAKTIRAYTKQEFSHSSICLSEDFKDFYSFSRKYTHNPFIGCFSIENTNKNVYSLFDNIPCKVLEVEVTDYQYDLIKTEIENMLCNKDLYKYNYFGIVYAIVNKPYNANNRYYCSEFVYHILKIGQVLNNEFDKVSIKPNDFLSLNFKVIYEGNLHNLNSMKNIKISI